MPKEKEVQVGSRYLKVHEDKIIVGVPTAGKDSKIEYSKIPESTSKNIVVTAFQDHCPFNLGHPELDRIPSYKNQVIEVLAQLNTIIEETKWNVDTVIDAINPRTNKLCFLIPVYGCMYSSNLKSKAKQTLIKCQEDLIHRSTEFLKGKDTEFERQNIPIRFRIPDIYPEYIILEMRNDVVPIGHVDTFREKDEGDNAKTVSPDDVTLKQQSEEPHEPQNSNIKANDGSARRKPPLVIERGGLDYPTNDSIKNGNGKSDQKPKRPFLLNLEEQSNFDPINIRTPQFGEIPDKKF